MKDLHEIMLLFCTKFCFVCYDLHSIIYEFQSFVVQNLMNGNHNTLATVPESFVDLLLRLKMEKSLLVRQTFISKTLPHISAISGEK